MPRPCAPALRALTAFCLPLSLAAATPADFDTAVRPYFKDHCYKCHGPEKQKGDLRLDELSLDLSGPKTLAHWTDILDRINTGDMPPKKEPRPDARATAGAVDWITARISEAENARLAGIERVSFHKLTRDEYANSVRALLGVTYDAHDTTGMSEDPDFMGFDRIGSVLSLSPSHIEKYLAAADAVLSEALAVGPAPKREVIRWTPFDIRSAWRGLQKDYEEFGTADKVRVDIVPNNTACGNPGSNTTLRLAAGGDYIIRVKLSGLRAHDGVAPYLRVAETDLGRTLYAGEIEAPEDQPRTIEFRAHLPAGNRLIRITNDAPGPEPTARRSRPAPNDRAFTTLRHRLPWQLRLTDDQGRPERPILLMDWIEWEGPVNASWPTPAHREIFGQGGRDAAHVRDIVARFATRAFRRPATAAETERYAALADRELAAGKPFEAAVKTSLLAILCAKDFLYLVEGKADAPSARLDDHELASRLSYFLWSAPPDDTLLALAREGRLHDRTVLAAQTRRMLADPRAAAFAEAFPYQWLQLRRIGMFAPDKTLYPEYDAHLEQSMIAETLGFFREVLTRNLSIREFLDSDWTMANERLAAFYGIPGVRGDELRRVALTPDMHRGGILTQGAILGLTSDGTRHRPVHRGKWLAESILGKPVPPPPANVPAIKTAEANKPKNSLREKLAAHLQDPACAACHVKIDPLGVAFENYDAIGRWRTVETVRDGSGANPKVDASAELVDGRKFADSVAFRRILLDDSDRFAAALTEKLATFGMRRVMAFSDRAQLQQIAAQGKADGYRLADLVEHLVTSDLFQRR